MTQTKETAQIRRFPETTLSEQSLSIIAKIEKTVWKEKSFLSDWETDLAIFLYSHRTSAKHEVLNLLRDERIDYDKYISREDVSALMDDYCAVIEFCLNSYEHQSYMSRRGEVDIQPIAITKLCLSLLDDISVNDVVYNPFAGMSSYPAYLPDVKFVGEEINQKTWALSQIRLDAFNSNSEIALADSIANYRNNAEKYAAIVTTPPFGFKDVVSALLYMAENNLKPDGTMLCILPESFCTATGGCWFDMRKTLVERGWLKAVIMLPAIFQETNINTCIVVVEHTQGEDVIMVDASKDFVASQDSYYSPKPFAVSFKWESVLWTIKNRDKRYCVAKLYDELDNNGIWRNVNPARYLFKLPEIEHPVKHLYELAIVESPRTVRDYSGQILTGTDFSQSYLTCAIASGSSKRNQANRSRHVVTQNCMLVYVISGKVKVGRINDIEQLGGAVAVPDETVILTRTSSEITDEYLLKMLVDDYVAAQVAAYSVGITIKRISKEDLEQIYIPVPELELQDKEIKDDLHRNLSVSERLVQTNIDQYKADVRQKKHAMGQTVFNLNNWWGQLKKARIQGNGVLHDDDTVGKIHKNSIADIFTKIDSILGALSSQLATFSITDGLTVEDISLAQFVEDYIANPAHSSPMFSYRYSLPKNEFVEVPALEFDSNMIGTLTTAMSWISFPKKALERIFDNIVHNACSHGFAGREEKENYIRISFFHQDDNCVIEISNNGIPLAKDMTPDKVFIFGESNAIGSDNHLGLGAAQVKDLVTEFGGRVELISTPKEEYTVTYRMTFSDPTIIHFGDEPLTL